MFDTGRCEPTNYANPTNKLKIIRTVRDIRRFASVKGDECWRGISEFYENGKEIQKFQNIKN